jgi:hypothetical protein
VKVSEKKAKFSKHFAFLNEVNFSDLNRVHSGVRDEELLVNMSYEWMIKRLLRLISLKCRDMSFLIVKDSSSSIIALFLYPLSDVVVGNSSSIKRFVLNHLHCSSTGSDGSRSIGRMGVSGASL